MISTSTRNRTAKRIPSIREEGFTLVEVMIAIVLLVMISVAIYQATTQTFKYRAKIINEGDFYGGIRLAMGLLDRDIGALFSPVNLNPKNFPDPNNPSSGGKNPDGSNANNTVDFPTRTGGFNSNPRGGGANGVDPQTAAAQAQQLEELQRSELGQTTDFWLGATDLTAIRPTRFVGTENKLSFVTASHMRIYKNSPECEYAKVVYELREEKNSEIGDDVKTLVKIEDPMVFDDTSNNKGKEAKIYPLLPGVKRFKFRYFRRDKKAWETTWDTNRDDMKGLYPDLIELTIEVAGLSKLAYRGIYMFHPETPFYGMDPTL
ncbi:MAG: prepilin-type N-terminal cleavage/methylation domain-containing protein [Bdellovibrionales bacterium]|nr:prepilin-type N-terminal cleavage/methylation domain-containing protein [Bdellovibrionales bacterium]